MGMAKWTLRMLCWDDPDVTTAIQQIPLQAIDGSAATLGDYQGDVLLVVNVASKCGLTPQYEALERLYEEFRDRGFAVLGEVVDRFAPDITPDDEQITAAIERELQAG
jgi:glutathione peroxidase